MRNKFFIVSFLSILLFTACKKEMGTTKTQEEIASVAANRTSPKITVCHYDAKTGTNKTILINETAWPDHQAHGDVLGDCSAVLVKICDQYWMKRNLDVATYRDGTPIPQVQDGTAWAALTTGAWCYYENNTANGTTYGKLYNWYAVAGIHDNDPSTPNKVLAPAGWHVPTNAEWSTLATCLGGEYVAGGKMKTTGTIEGGTGLWSAPNTGATNSSGFTGLPGGLNINGASQDVGLVGFWWSAQEVNTLLAWARNLDNINVSFNGGSTLKQWGVSVRCLRD